MSLRGAFVLLAVLTACAAPPSPARAPEPASRIRPPFAGAAAASPAALLAARCAVWEREVSFARSVEAHDAAAFSEHVLAGALFVDGDKVLHGRGEIAEAWAPILKGGTLRFFWYPTTVEVTGDPHVALSRGPFWYTVTKPGAAPESMSGSFQSVWVLDTDGEWRVTIDGGGPPPVAANVSDIAKLRDARPASCPFPS